METINIDEYKVTNGEDLNLNLTDNIVAYNNGIIWKIVPLKIMLRYSFLYDYYYVEDKKYLVTLVVCPVSLRSVLLKGKFEFKQYNNTQLILQENETHDILPIDLNSKIDENFIVSKTKRSEVKILTLKNALLLIRDFMYVSVNKKKIKKHMRKIYYSNLLDNNNKKIISEFHPKTLIYIIHYKSRKTGKDKYSLVIGKNISKTEVTGYDIQKSGVSEYLNNYQQKIINREGYTYPCLLYVALKEYDKSRIVYLA
jgi:hypothetical protein